jgi:hypothetical protein
MTTATVAPTAPATAVVAPALSRSKPAKATKPAKAARKASKPAKATKPAKGSKASKAIVDGANGRRYFKGVKPIASRPWIGAVNISTNHRGFTQTDSIVEGKPLAKLGAPQTDRITKAGAHRGDIVVPSGVKISKCQLLRLAGTWGWSFDDCVTLLSKFGIGMTQANFNCQHGDGRRYTDEHGVMSYPTAGDDKGNRKKHSELISSLTKADRAWLEKLAGV